MMSHHHSRNLFFWSSVCFLVLAMSYFGWHCWRGLWSLSFGDEAEHLLGGRVIDGGGRLYRDYIDTHGPVIFMITQAYGAIFGWGFPQGARLFMPILALVAVGAVGFSPIRTESSRRLIAAAVFLSGLSIWWLVEGLYFVSFYPLGGFLCVLAIGVCCVPAWCGYSAPRGLMAIGGATLVLLDFTAYAYGPGSILIGFASLWPSLRRRDFRPLMAFSVGAAMALGAMLCWLHLYGSVTGFLAYHIIFNQTAYAPFIDPGIQHAVSGWSPSLKRNLLSLNVTHLLLLLGFCVALLRCGSIGAVSICLTFAGVILFNIRAAIEFKDGQTLVSALALFALSLVPPGRHALGGERSGKWATYAVCLPVLGGMLVLAHHAVVSPFGWSYAEMSRQPRFTIYQPWNDAMSNKVRALASREDSVLALPYFPEFYWATDRMPPIGFYEYLPWDFVWARHGKEGEKFYRNLCAELDRSQPKIIHYQENSEKIFENDSYYTCVKQKIAAYYVPVSGFDALFVRRDDRMPAGPMPAKGLPHEIR